MSEATAPPTAPAAATATTATATATAPITAATSKTSTSTTVPLCVDVSARLTAAESEVFEILRQTGAKLGTVVRVAGGWVRDKLLGKPSDDVDVALDNCSGIAFANEVNKLIAARAGDGSGGGGGGGGCGEGSGGGGTLMSRVTVIKANPEKSKHLETATCRLGGIELDFVNLRTEQYDGASDGRIPRRVFSGTAEEDAFRRDITINSLFYNVTTSAVEDLTGRGVRDLLVDRVIRTPLDPRVTFKDDPLRVLRAVRFAAVLDGFELAPDLCAAARSPEVQQCLRRKVRRERVQKELHKMLCGCRPLHGLRLLHGLGLLPVVFEFPSPELRIDMLDEDTFWREAMRRLDLLEAVAGAGHGHGVRGGGGGTRMAAAAAAATGDAPGSPSLEEEGRGGEEGYGGGGDGSGERGRGQQGSEPWVRAEMEFTKELQRRARRVQCRKWRAQMVAEWHGPDAAGSGGNGGTNAGSAGAGGGGSSGGVGSLGGSGSGGRRGVDAQALAAARAKSAKMRKRHPTLAALHAWLDAKTAHWQPPLQLAGGAVATDVEDLELGTTDPSYRLLLLAVLLSPLYFKVRPGAPVPALTPRAAELQRQRKATQNDNNDGGAAAAADDDNNSQPPKGNHRGKPPKKKPRKRGAKGKQGAAKGTAAEVAAAAAAVDPARLVARERARAAADLLTPCDCTHLPGHGVIAGYRCWRGDSRLVGGAGGGGPSKVTSVFHYVLSQSLKESSKLIAAVTTVVQSSLSLRDILDRCFPPGGGNDRCSGSGGAQPPAASLWPRARLSNQQRMLLGWWVATAGPVWPLAWTTGAVASLSARERGAPSGEGGGGDGGGCSAGGAGCSAAGGGGDGGSGHPAGTSTGRGGNATSDDEAAMLSSPRGGARVAGALERRGLHRWAFLPATIIGTGLHRCSCRLPIIDGQALREVLGQGSGPRIGVAKVIVSAWQTVHPAGGAAECRTYLKSLLAADEKYFRTHDHEFQKAIRDMKMFKKLRREELMRQREPRCADCGTLGHMSSKNPKCLKHVPVSALPAAIAAAAAAAASARGVATAAGTRRKRDAAEVSNGGDTSVAAAGGSNGGGGGGGGAGEASAAGAEEQSGGAKKRPRRFKGLGAHFIRREASTCGGLFKSVNQICHASWAYLDRVLPTLDEGADQSAPPRLPEPSSSPLPPHAH